MMYRYVLIALLIFSGAVALAQDKTVGPMFALTEKCWEPPCRGPMTWVDLQWSAPDKEPDSYRVSWKMIGQKWLSYKKANTQTRGNAFVEGASYNIRGLQIPYGSTLRIRVRARYDGEKNGPWRCCFDITND